VEYINGAYYYSTAVRQANGINGFDTLTAYAVSKNDIVVGAVNVNTMVTLARTRQALPIFPLVGRLPTVALNPTWLLME